MKYVIDLDEDEIADLEDDFYCYITKLRVTPLKEVFANVNTEINNLINESRICAGYGDYESIINTGMVEMGEAILEILDRNIAGKNECERNRPNSNNVSGKK